MPSRIQPKPPNVAMKSAALDITVKLSLYRMANRQNADYAAMVQSAPLGLYVAKMLLSIIANIPTVMVTGHPVIVRGN